MQLRIARHTNKLKDMIAFYGNLVGLSVLGEFKSHAGYEGVFLGNDACDWHLEFTSSNEDPNHQFDEDDLLVFYPVSQFEFDEIVLRLEQNDIFKAIPKNPYWNDNAECFFDPDGYIIAISSQKI